MSQKRDQKSDPNKPTDKSEARRDYKTPAAAQLGATEQQVTPLTPPMAESDEQPGDPNRRRQPDPGIDPAEELTPG